MIEAFLYSDGAPEAVTLMDMMIDVGVAEDEELAERLLPHLLGAYNALAEHEGLEVAEVEMEREAIVLYRTHYLARYWKRKPTPEEVEEETDVWLPDCLYACLKAHGAVPKKLVVTMAKVTGSRWRHAIEQVARMHGGELT